MSFYFQDALPVLPPGCQAESPETIQEFITKAKAALVAVGIVRDSALGTFSFRNMILVSFIVVLKIDITLGFFSDHEHYFG